MEQMKVDPSVVVTVHDLPAAAVILKPIVFTEGDTFCYLLGPDPQSGIFGCGDSPQDALEDWEDSLRERVNVAQLDDDVALEIIAKLKKLNAEKHEHANKEVQRFYDQFMPGRKR